MVYSRIFLKLYAGFVVVIIFTTAIVSLMIARQMQQDSLLEIEKSLNSQASILRESIHPLLSSGQHDELQERLVQLTAHLTARATVISKDGTVLADTDQNPVNMDNHLNRSEVQQALETGFGVASRYSTTLSKPMRYLALSISDDNYPLAYVRVALPLSLIDQRLDRLRNVVIVAAILTSIIALFLGFWIARNFAQPLREMTSMAQRVTQGDYQQHLEIERRDELGELAIALNQMAKTASERMEIITTDRNKLAAILTGMVEGVIAVDDGMRIIHMNKAAAEVIDTAPEACLGRLLSEVTGLTAIHEAIKECLSGHGVVQSKLQLSSPERHFDLYAVVLQEKGSQPAGAVLVIHHVTDLYKLEVIRRDFVANASHELKTPLTAIRGFTETMLDDVDIDEKTRNDFLEKIRGQTLRLSALASDLLALSRIESSDSGPYDQIDIRETIENCTNALQSAVLEKKQTLIVNLPDEKVIVLADEKGMFQLLDNLADNAINYTPAGGSIEVSLKMSEKEVIIEVKDSGIGIDLSEQERIFERFYRVDKSHSRLSEGTGLGLSIVKHIVMKHGGQISVVSSPDNGSVFRVSVPLENS